MPFPALFPAAEVGGEIEGWGMAEEKSLQLFGYSLLGCLLSEGSNFGATWGQS